MSSRYNRIRQDGEIIDLLFARSEQGLDQIQSMYGKLFIQVARNILGNEQDAEECVNDTYIDAWNSIPPHKPENLKTFLGKLTRNISIDRWRALRTQKNGGGEMFIAFDELTDCASALSSVEQIVENKELVDAYIRFLDTLPTSHRRAFLLRYWYVEPISSIADKLGFSEGKIKSILHRTRKKLQSHLKKEGF